MSPSGAEYIKRIREQITEVDPSEVNELLHEGAVIIDVREADEYMAGHLPGTPNVPRSYLESRIEGTAPDRSQRVILYCQSGQRSVQSAAGHKVLPCCSSFLFRIRPDDRYRSGGESSAAQCRTAAYFHDRSTSHRG